MALTHLLKGSMQPWRHWFRCPASRAMPPAVQGANRAVISSRPMLLLSCNISSGLCTGWLWQARVRLALARQSSSLLPEAVDCSHHQGQAALTLLLCKQLLLACCHSSSA